MVAPAIGVTQNLIDSRQLSVLGGAKVIALASLGIGSAAAERELSEWESHLGTRGSHALQAGVCARCRRGGLSCAGLEHDNLVA